MRAGGAGDPPGQEFTASPWNARSVRRPVSPTGGRRASSSLARRRDRRMRCRGPRRRWSGSRCRRRRLRPPRRSAQRHSSRCRRQRQRGTAREGGRQQNGNTDDPGALRRPARDVRPAEPHSADQDRRRRGEQGLQGRTARCRREGCRLDREAQDWRRHQARQVRRTAHHRHDDAQRRGTAPATPASRTGCS